MPTDKPDDVEVFADINAAVLADAEDPDVSDVQPIGDRPWFEHCLDVHGTNLDRPDHLIVYEHGAAFPTCTWYPGQPKPETTT